MSKIGGPRLSTVGRGLHGPAVKALLTTYTLMAPLRLSSTNIHPNAKWIQNGSAVDGGNGQLPNPHGLYVDDDQTVYLADTSSHRIVECGGTNRQVVADENGERSGAHQLSLPRDVIVDKAREGLIIYDWNNRRVVR
ncbi:unnamed protein product [Didymodactylos carnosus]|uniref:NHL repeat-containing protein n=1 Tax=Didymodactylos carnosus TaxID=1234261 RepID=A0A815AC73_9BILA|nr:unnamed protein product [Didymodactylos carnosus]CAF4026232.1 unnamed protein product [Didymodactylos carnosus]